MPLGAEVNEHSDIDLHTDDPAEAVLVVAHPVPHRKLFDDRIMRSIVEGTCGQIPAARASR